MSHHEPFSSFSKTAWRPGSDPLCSLPVPLLIQIPDLGSFSTRSRGQSPRTADWQARVHRRSKRRLRREVRIAGCSLLGIIPLALAVAYWPSAAVGRPVASRVLAITGEPSKASTASWKEWLGFEKERPATRAAMIPPVRLSLESISAIQDEPQAAPAVFPGYLLPDDNR
jgi:hypothetical protein